MTDPRPGEARASNHPDGEFPLTVLEDDETVPPRPEEELADVERSVPDPRV